MPTYITLMSWTEQGIKTYADTVDRFEAAQKAAQAGGGSFREAFWTIGPYDLVGIIEAPDDETVAAALLRVGAQGNIRTTTMRAFTADEMRGVIADAAG
jgi:uncharacterized protein with GYD domain